MVAGGEDVVEGAAVLLQRLTEHPGDAPRPPAARVQVRGDGDETRLRDPRRGGLVVGAVADGVVHHDHTGPRPVTGGILRRASIGPPGASMRTVVTVVVMVPECTEPRKPSRRWRCMAMRLFLLYAVVETAVLVALVSAIGLGWTLLISLATFVVGLALAGSQLKRQLHRLRSGLTATTAQGAVTDSALVALGTVLVVVPGIASSVVGALLLLPPTRAAARPVVTALAARRLGRRVPIVVVGAPTGPRRGDYIDGEVVEVVTVDPGTVEPSAVERRVD